MDVGSSRRAEALRLLDLPPSVARDVNNATPVTSATASLGMRRALKADEPWARVVASMPGTLHVVLWVPSCFCSLYRSERRAATDPGEAWSGVCICHLITGTWCALAPSGSCRAAPVNDCPLCRRTIPRKRIVYSWMSVGVTKVVGKDHMHRVK